MNGSIPIDPEKGLDPQLTVCPICGQRDGGIAMVGRSMVAECSRCDEKTVYYAGRVTRHCHCGGDLVNRRRYDPEQDGPLGGGMCDRCQSWLVGDWNIIKCTGCRRIYQFAGVNQVKESFDSRDYMNAEETDLDWDRLIEEGKVEKIVGKVIPQETCHYCNPDLPTPEGAEEVING